MVITTTPFIHVLIELPNKILGAVHKCQHFHKCTNNTLSETPASQKKSTYQQFLSAQKPHENNQNQAKMYGKNVDFHRPPSPHHPPPHSRKVYGLYTRENVDIYGRPLSK